MLSKVKLTNFKCFEYLDLDCTQLNLLCGLNGMGKSSVIQALLVLQQSFETGELIHGRLVLGGDRVDLGAGSDVMFEDAKDDVVGFELHCAGWVVPWVAYFAYAPMADQLTMSSDGGSGGAVWIEGPTFEYSKETGQLTEVSDSTTGFHVTPVSDDWREVPPFGGRLVYVNAERIGPRKLYPISEVLVRHGDFGSSGEYAWNFLNHHQNDLLKEDDPRCVEGERRRLRDVVDRWLQDVCPGAHLQLEELTDADALIAGFSFDRPGDVPTRRYRATNVGFGLSYVLPVILALLSEPGTLCLIENPEAHLHPRGQTKLAELAARAAVAGVQVFAETHSDHFMDGVRIAVRDGIIAPEQASFHYFEREGSKSVVSSPQINADGRLSHWPDGFFDQHEENLIRLLGPRT